MLTVVDVFSRVLVNAIEFTIFCFG